jgi:hypothetical protein
MGVLPSAALALSLGKGTDIPVNQNVPDQEWQEQQVVPPAMPQDANLIEVHIGSNTTNRFFIDQTSLSIGPDSVVRYVLVVKTTGGATNVTFEGIRCKTTEYKIYALGRADGTWTPSRTNTWRPIENNSLNRQHAVLSHDFFCPSGGTIINVDEGRDALRRSKHPAAL